MPDTLTPEAIRAAVQAAADNPDAPHGHSAGRLFQTPGMPEFVAPSTAGKSVLVFDEAMCMAEHGVARMTAADRAVLFPLGRWSDTRESTDA